MRQHLSVLRGSAAKRTRTGIVGLSLLIALVPGGLLASTAAAYPVTDSTFAGGASSASVDFAVGGATLSGPSVRLLTNATFTGASLTVAGSESVANFSATRTSTADFLAASALTNLAVGSGNLSLNTTTAVTEFNGSNAFGGGTHSGTAVSNGSLVASGPFAGTYATPSFATAGRPLGWFFAAGQVPGGASVTFNLLDQGGALLLGDLQPGTRIPLSADEAPQIRIQVVLTPSGGSQPAITSFGLGQRASDSLLGAGLVRAAGGGVLEGQSFHTVVEPATLTKYSGNPVVNNVAATYYSRYLSQPYVMDVNGTWWMYVSAGVNNGHAGAGIARATSTDLTTWTMGASVLLGPTASTFDSYALSHAYVIPNPEGSGYVMYYTGWTSPQDGTLGRATSPDGVTWTKTGQVLAPSSSGWDSFAVGEVARVTYTAASDTWTMWYSGTSTTNGGGSSLGVATSNNGIAWTRYAGNPVMWRGAVGDVDQDDAQGGKMGVSRGTLYYYYSCNPGGGYYVCLATSTDGYAWSKVGAVINRTAAAFDSQYASDATPVFTGNDLYVFYAGYDGSNSRIGRTSAVFRAASLTGRFDLLSGASPDTATFTKSPMNPVIDIQPGTYYSNYLSHPMILRVGTEWWMYLTAGTGFAHNGAGISRAVSTDLLGWTMDPTPLMVPTASTPDEGGMLHPYVLRDPLGSGFIMYYTALNSAGVSTIARATSPDGLIWTKAGQVLAGSSTGWDAYSVGQTAYVTRDANQGLWRMWYGGWPASGGVQVGVATSTDGLNWTRYAGNPVLARGGAGSVDRDTAQGGHVIDIGGVWNFYYTCVPGTGKVNSCLALSTDGGYTWSKVGAVLNASASDFDQGYAADPEPFLTDDAFYLFYGGFNAGTSKIGRADGAYNPAAPGAAFGGWGQLPRAFTRFAANATPGSGVTGSFQIRSSNDGVSWSAFEPVTANDSTIGTPVRRFVEYRASFNAGSAYSTFQSARLDLLSYYERGTYVSDIFAFPEAATRALVLPAAGGTGAIRWFLSSDGGSQFSPVDGQAWTDLAPAANALLLRGEFDGTAGQTPTLYGVNVTVEAPGLPEMVTVRLGLAGTALLVAAGPLSGAAAVVIPVGDLDTAVAGGLFVDPTAAYVDAPVRISSTHYGKVTVSGLTLDYVLKNPLTGSTAPGAQLITINETETVALSIAAATLPGIALNYSWVLDGAPAGTAASFSWTTDYDDAGFHIITGAVENGDFAYNWTWPVTVLNKNRLPVIGFAEPGEDTLTMSHAQTADFRVGASDPDGEALTYLWTVSGSPWGTLNNTTISGFSDGAYNVSVRVSDGLGSVSRAWQLRLTNGAPTISAADPPGDVTVSYRTAVRLSASASDADGDELTYQWTVDGVTQLGANQNSTEVTSPGPANRTVRLTVSDGPSQSTRQWVISFVNAAPTILAAFPPGSVGIDTRAAQSFRVNASDPDGGPLTYMWLVDGQAVVGSGAVFTTEGEMGGGSHTVTVVVADDRGLTATASWSFVTPAAPPVTVVQDPGFDIGLLVLIGLLAAAAMVAVVLVLRRRGRDSPP